MRGVSNKGLNVGVSSSNPPPHTRISSSSELPWLSITPQTMAHVSADGIALNDLGEEAFGKWNGWSVIWGSGRREILSDSGFWMVIELMW